MENILITVMLVFVGMTFVLLGFVMWKTFGKEDFSKSDSKFFLEQWRKILGRAMTDPKHAILDADKLLDLVLKKKGYRGSLGEKLKKSGKLFSDLNGVWSAHKVRNKIAHELNFEVSEKESKRVLSQFARALRDLGLKV